MSSAKPAAFGRHLEVKFATSFDGLSAATETVTLAVQPHGEWKAIGYLIKPAGAGAEQSELRDQQVSTPKMQVETIASSSGRQSAQTESGREEASQSRLRSATNQAPRFSRTAIVGAAWIGICPVGVFLVPALLKLSAASPNASIASVRNWSQSLLQFPLWALLLLGYLAPLGTTILGWVAASQIRRSTGKLHGMWLAILDGLLFPLLLLDAVLLGSAIGAYQSVIGQTLPMMINPFWFVVMLLVPLAIDYVIIRRVWRAVNKPVADMPPAKTLRNRSFRQALKDGTTKVVARSEGPALGRLGRWNRPEWRVGGLLLLAAVFLVFCSSAPPGPPKPGVLALHFAGYTNSAGTRFASFTVTNQAAIPVRRWAACRIEEQQQPGKRTDLIVGVSASLSPGSSEGIMVPAPNCRGPWRAVVFGSQDRWRLLLFDVIGRYSFLPRAWRSAPVPYSAESEWIAP